MPVCSPLAAHTRGSGHKRIFREDRFVYLWVTVKRTSGSCQENRFTRAFLEESEPNLVVKGLTARLWESGTNTPHENVVDCFRGVKQMTPYQLQSDRLTLYYDQGRGLLLFRNGMEAKKYAPRS
jgi:hypothetical protein